MRLPKVNSPVYLTFPTLRLAGSYLGVMETDDIATRLCRRVITNRGWKWQIMADNWEWDHSIDIWADKDCLDEIGMDTSDIKITAINEFRNKFKQ